MPRNPRNVMKSVRTLSSDSQLSPDVLRVIIEGCSEPLVVKGQLEPWIKSRPWKATQICEALKSTHSSFKLFPKRGTAKYKAFSESERRVAFETDCLHVEATFGDFKEWIEYSQATPPVPEATPSEGNKRPPSSKPVRAAELLDKTVPLSHTKTCSNALLAYSATEFWVYADYNYMCNICKDTPELLSAVDWSFFGFEGRSGKDSALWVGSEGACTPCHYDTYGYNIVAVLAGEKTWTLFGPGDTASMYPSRVPFEESSVFSEVDVVQPDHKRHPLHSNATPYQVLLREGDVLVVPKHWWHYVECTSRQPSVSINTWIQLPSDSHDKIKEAVVRTLVSALVLEDTIDRRSLVNPNEELFSNETNVHFLSVAVGNHITTTLEQLVMKKSDLESHRDASADPENRVTYAAFLKALTSDAVVDCIVTALGV